MTNTIFKAILLTFVPLPLPLGDLGPRGPRGPPRGDRTRGSPLFVMFRNMPRGDLIPTCAPGIIGRSRAADVGMLPAGGADDGVGSEDAVADVALVCCCCCSGGCALSGLCGGPPPGPGDV